MEPTVAFSQNLPPSRAERPLWVNLLLLALVLYAFFFSIELMSKSIKLFGGDLAQHLFTLTSNPWIALFIGLGATSLMQSSSATTSMVVAMVASGALKLELAVPIIMGANIGTSVTNTMVSMGHIGRPSEFRRAFAASTVHDMFNLLAVAVFFPIELMTGMFSKFGVFMASQMDGAGGLKLLNPLKMIVKPTVHAVKSGLESAFGHVEGVNLVAWFALFIALAVLFFAISRLTKVLKLIFMGKADSWFQNRLFNHPMKALALGLTLTVMVQSSSITTSLIVPIAGAGILTLRQIFPYTLGANVGTTVTAIMASMATQNPASVAIALVHLSFNIMGTLMIWPIRNVPVIMAEALAEFSLRNKFIPLAYVLLTFIALPLGVIFLTTK
jgi:solute carrier family 34 (sodium-dependent phosphate cotransporter)